MHICIWAHPYLYSRPVVANPLILFIPSIPLPQIIPYKASALKRKQSSPTPSLPLIPLYRLSPCTLTIIFISQIIPCKASSLKKKTFNSSDDAEDGRRRYNAEESKSGIEKKRVVIREKAILPDMYHLQIGYSNKSETCVLYPRVPKAWLANGFIIVPSLSEKGNSYFFLILDIIIIISMNIATVTPTYHRRYKSLPVWCDCSFRV